MKKRAIFGLIAFVLFAGSMAFFVSQTSSHYLTRREQPKESAVDCQKQLASHTITIQNNNMTPRHTAANICDSLTITNDDNAVRLIAFGEHDHHLEYDGVSEKALHKNQSLTITLNQAGTYTLHDHLHDEVAGDFTVTP